MKGGNVGDKYADLFEETNKLYSDEKDPQKKEQLLEKLKFIEKVERDIESLYKMNNECSMKVASLNQELGQCKSTIEHPKLSLNTKK